MFESEHSPESRSCSRSNEFYCRQSFTDEEGSFRLETTPRNLQCPQQDLGSTSDRSICQSAQHSATEILRMDSRSRSRSNRCLSTEMVQTEHLGEPTLDSNSQNLIQGYQRKSYNDHISPLVGISSIVSTDNGLIDRTSNSNTSEGYNSERITPSRKSISQSEMENTRMQNIRTRYQNKGFSEKAIELLLASLDINSSKTVSSNLKVWISWCRARTIDPVTCDLSIICEFFVDMMNEGKAYNTIAGYRSAISEIHQYVDNVPIGQHPDITKAISAVFKIQPPPMPKDELMDISPSLNFICELGNNDLMSIRDLLIKTAFLVALVSASRPSDLARIDISTIKESSNGLSLDCLEPKEYKIARAHSSSTSKSRTKKIFVGKYSENIHLCPYSAVKDLLSRTESWRDTANKRKSLFLISRHPYNPAASDTIAGWIKSAMQHSSSDSTAKDVRSTSASLAQKAGLDLSTILSMGNWSSNTTYQKFYQKGIKMMLEKNQVSEVILKEAYNI